ncbi:PRD domain-containing protein [Enterococcus pseudoavium]|uniref:PRD domain-containing protein n=1 Tax=Enterococcus pseudoavium TaxID=44007 RepID=A0ABU3FIW0_9ENTE|nr:PRD domain-containing protein [Enterococcus pseudoavium]MDT2754274.1 PRD domain-containing protein [Enterococcus pseudoavium]MDT2769944.1 PRD domain-containing protein [Enterococcus pseudoavium]REC32933.1 transcriptional antiterminator [Enterococcus pseudoavium]
MKMSAEALKIIDESQTQEKLKQVMALLEVRLAEHEIVPTELQWTILINHLNEMLKRSSGEGSIPKVEPEMFSEVSKEALAISDEVVKTIGNLSEDEMYVLSIHFETAKNN